MLCTACAIRRISPCSCTHGSAWVLRKSVCALVVRPGSPPRPFLAPAECLRPGVECALVPELNRVRTAIQLADAALLQGWANFDALHSDRIRVPVACGPEGNVQPHRSFGGYVLAHALSLFCPTCWQSKEKCRTRRSVHFEINQAEQHQRMRWVFVVLLLPIRTTAQFDYCFISRLPEKLLVTLADGKSAT
jgi:hypothetical protein